MRFLTVETDPKAKAGMCFGVFGGDRFSHHNLEGIQDAKPPQVAIYPIGRGE